MAKAQTEQTEVQTEATSEDATKPTETKREAFVRLASKRVTNISHALKLLHPLTNKANYDYVPAHWEAIKNQIAKDLKELDEAIAGTKPTVQGFDLSSIEAPEAPAEQPAS